MCNNELKEKLKLLIELYNRGKFQEVLSKGNTIKSKFPRYLIIYNILGESNTGLKKYSNAINCFRIILKNSDKTEHKKITSSQDFYSLSTFRDLIFHEKEHQFNLLKIKGSLEKLGLVFSGFENKKILKDFKTKYKYSGDQYDLHKWNDFEKNNPDIFIGMYQFWCQKLN